MSVQSTRILVEYEEYEVFRTFSERSESTVRPPVSDIMGQCLNIPGLRLPLAHLLRQGELLRLREPQKWILRPIWGLEGYTQGSADYYP
jgi:hypothetical protein